MRISDWSSDVCSSDLDHVAVRGAEINRIADLDRGRLEIEFLAALVLARPGQITRMIFPDAFERADIVRRDLREWAEARPRLVASVIAPVARRYRNADRGRRQGLRHLPVAVPARPGDPPAAGERSDEHTSELQSL